MNYNVLVDDVGDINIIFDVGGIAIKYPLRINDRKIKVKIENSLWICPKWKIDTLVDLNSVNRNWIIYKSNGIYNAENIGYKKFSVLDDCIQEINDDLNYEIGIFYEKDSADLYFPISYVSKKYKNTFKIFQFLGLEKIFLENAIKRDKYVKWICNVCDLRIDLKESKSFMWTHDKVIKIKMKLK